MILISMTDFVLEQKELKIMRLAKLHKIEKYANFLKQPLNLGMFVPCDENGNILEEPSNYQLYELGVCPNDSQINECGNYEIAKEKVLLKCVALTDAKFIIWSNKTIEDLVQYNLYLTETAIKKITQ